MKGGGNAAVGVEGLAGSLELLRQILDAANDAIIVDDEQGRIVYANRAFMRLFGFAPDTDIHTIAIEDYVHPEDGMALRERHARRFAGEDVPRRFSYRGSHRDGRDLTVEVTVTPVELDGRIAGTHSILRDVTERAQREARERQRQKMETVGRLTSGIVHDFNNILTSVMAHLDLAEISIDDPHHPILEHLTASRQGIGRTADMLRRLLRLARTGDVETRPMDVNAVVQEAVSLIGGGLGEARRIRLQTELRARWQIDGDATQVHQVLQNLVFNACEALPDGGTIEIQTEDLELRAGVETAWAEVPPGAYLRLTVSDDGVGIAPSIQHHILEPFFTTKPGGKNSGLGLATVYAIVQGHRAHLDLQSEPGRGTTFSVYFPAVAARSSPEPEPEANAGDLPEAADGAGASPPSTTATELETRAMLEPAHGARSAATPAPTSQAGV